jgi:hypothetical protein
MLFILVPLIFVFYFGTLALAAFVFPESYDWRSSVISNLLSPHCNPQFHWLASIGLSSAALLATPFGGYISSRLRRASRLGAKTGKVCFVVGTAALVLAAIVVPRHSHPVVGPLGVHEILARLSALALGLGVLCFCWCALCVAYRSRFSQPFFNRALVLSWTLLMTLIVVTVTICLCSELFRRTGILEASPFYKTLRHSPLWRLAFWEWIGSAAGFLFLASAAFLLPDRENDRA